VGEISAGEYRECVASSLRWATVSEGGWPKDAPENTGKQGGFGEVEQKLRALPIKKRQKENDFPSNHHVLRSERKKPEKRIIQSLEGCVHLLNSKNDIPII